MQSIVAQSEAGYRSRYAEISGRESYNQLCRGVRISQPFFLSLDVTGSNDTFVKKYHCALDLLLVAKGQKFCRSILELLNIYRSFILTEANPDFPV